MNDYTYKDMMRMQSEAKQRVLEMQKRSKAAASHYNYEREKNKVNREDNEDNRSELPRIAKAISYPTEITTGRKITGTEKDKKIVTGLRYSLKKIFGNIANGDSEKLFIMSLCLLLAEENTDDSLIVALMYLIT